MKGEEHILVNFPIDTSLKKKAHSALFLITSYGIISYMNNVHIEISIFAIGSTTFHECFFARGCTICFCFLRLYLLFLFPAKLWKLQNLGCHAGC